MTVKNSVFRNIVANPSDHINEINAQIPEGVVAESGVPLKFKAVFSIINIPATDYYHVEGSVERTEGVLEIWVGWLKLKLTKCTFADMGVGMDENIPQLQPADAIYKIVDKLGSCLNKDADYEWMYSLFLVRSGKIHDSIHNVEEHFIGLRLAESIIPVFGMIMAIKDGELSKKAMLELRGSLLFERKNTPSKTSLYHKLFSLERKVNDLAYSIACYNATQQDEFKKAVCEAAADVGHSFVSVSLVRGYGIRNVLSLAYNEVKYKDAPFDL